MTCRREKNRFLIWLIKKVFNVNLTKTTNIKFMKNWLRRAEGSWVLYGHYMSKRSLIVFIFNTKVHIMPTNLQLGVANVHKYY